jgi:antirestriction protein ArdC
MSRGFESRQWMTYKGAQTLGGQVRKGAKSELAFYVGAVTRERENSAGETVEATIPFLKSYLVFNVDEIEGLPAQYYAQAVAVERAPLARIAAADDFIGNTGAVIHHGGSRAFYQRSTDEIHLPPFDSFDSAEAYYATTAHEFIHWSGAEKRLDREKGKVFGNPTYAFEELIAELGAAYVCADLAISAEPRPDHAAYLASWIKALRDDNRAIFRAASYAEKACGYLHALQPGAAGEVAEAA